jgi:abequosyltransferase
VARPSLGVQLWSATMSTAPLITVAIPAYNRPEELAMLLESIAAQAFDSFDCLVVEDHSPRGKEIEAVAAAAQAKHPTLRLRYVSNEKNLGYDGNLRRILELSEGDFTLFMGDDDLLLPGALETLGAVLRKHDNLGVILRAYEQVDLKSGERIEIFRYFPTDRFFPHGADTIRTFFRRSVPIAGFTVHTESARALSTAEFDGTLLYQLYLSAMLLAKRDGYFVAQILTAMRKDQQQRHFFGSAESEKGLFAPGALTSEHSVNFMQGMVKIARAVDVRTKLDVLDGILRDLGNYSYAFLRLHAAKTSAFASYVRELTKLGFGRSPLFWAYSAALLVVPVPWLDRGIRELKKRLAATPRLGKVYAGEEPKSAP